MRTGRLVSKLIDDPLGNASAGVGRDQRRFEVVPESGINRRSAEDLLHIRDIRLTARIEALREPLPESLTQRRLRLDRHGWAR